MCERWKKFENFFADMGCRPEGKSLDRIDGTGDYSPENCRWATRSEQSSNRSNSLFVTYQGKTLTIAQWAREIGIDATTLRRRYHAGWETEKMLGPVQFMPRWHQL